MSRSVILCVDDEPGILKSLERCLVLENYEVIQAAGGEEGLRALQDRGGQVDLIIVDHRMPRMMGDEFLARVNEKYGPIKAIMLSGYASLESLSRVMKDGGMFRFLEKPWDNKKLLAEVKEAIAAPGVAHQ